MLSPDASGSDRAHSIGPPQVRLALSRWIGALALRPLLWSLPFVLLGCIVGRAWAEAIRAASPDDAILLAPALLGPLCIALRHLLLGRFSRLPLRNVDWGKMMLCGACVAGLVGAHAARRWTPARGDIARLLDARTSRMQPLQPVGGRIVAHVIEVRRGQSSDFAVLDLMPAPSTSRPLRGVGGRVWAELKHTPQVLAAGPLHAGDWIRARAELRASRAPGAASEPDERTFALLRGCWCEGEVKGVEARLPSPSGWTSGDINGLLESARERIAGRFERGFGELRVPYAAQSALLATAMAFGEGGLREPLPGELRRAFKRAGVSHVLVASGAQVALVCALLWALARLLCAPIRGQAARGVVIALLTVPTLIFYALLVGGAASIWRATLLGLGALWIQMRGRRMDALSLWCGALSLLLLCDPASLYDLSLQLSFGAAWGLIAFSPVLQNLLLAPLRALEPRPEAPHEGEESEQAPGPQARLRAWSQSLRSPDWWRKSARRAAWAGARGVCGVGGISVAAHIGTLPVLLYAFGTLSVGSVLANLPIVPMSALLVASGGASLLLPLRPIHLFNYSLADGTARVVGVVASWKSSWLEAPAPSLAWTLLLGALAIAGALAVWWPALLITTRRVEEEDLGEHEGPREPSAGEQALLWRASAQAAAEVALRGAMWMKNLLR